MIETPSPRQGQDVGQCLTAGVVEVHGDTLERDPVSARFDHAAGGERRPCPDGVAERDLLASSCTRPASDTTRSGDAGPSYGQPSTQER
jgi:hypothetical protein